MVPAESQPGALPAELAPMMPSRSSARCSSFLLICRALLGFSGAGRCSKSSSQPWRAQVPPLLAPCFSPLLRGRAPGASSPRGLLLCPSSCCSLP
ncbi:hypothetical protein Zm00014a_002253 [Zea mays]|uniref:Uncharacterized protein n=1 Tax=Zea mays TaxID=4577 RepID=A0A3L6DUA0_MAIZE|nr:hypothetical protein Zm00014a_002253 [Zea mays]